MGKTGKWIKNFLRGKKDKDKSAGNNQAISHGADQNPSTPISMLPTTPKEKRRWSFRRSSAPQANAQKELNGCGVDSVPVTSAAAAQAALLESENEQKKHALAVAAATAAAADAAVMAAQAAAAVIRLTAAASGRASAIEEVAAVKIQAAFRGYLARKALSALKGLVKLQALVRGHLVRKQAAATLRCMQALVTVQARARAQRIRMSDDSNSKPNINQGQSSFNHRRPPHDNRLRHSSYHEMEKAMEENIKIVEMDLGALATKTRNSYSTPTHSQSEPRFSTQSAPHARTYTKPDHRDLSPAQSPATELSPRAYSGHFEDYHSFATAQSSPHYFSSTAKIPPSSYFPKHDFADSLSSYDYPLFPNYMANTESSRAKARSQSAPKSRPETVMERQGSRRGRPSVEGRGGAPPRAVRMQRSSSHVGSAAQNYQYPWSVMKLDRSTVSLKDSECGSTSTMLTNNHNCRSLVGFEISGNRYHC